VIHIAQKAAILVAIAASMVPARAQEQPQSGMPTFRTGARMVLVPVVVRDREGRTVSDLIQENFRCSIRAKSSQ
jgi:hypothetical protein